MKKILLLSLLCISSYIGAAQEQLAKAVRSSNMQQVLDQLNDAKNGYDSHTLGQALWNAFSPNSQEIAELLIMRGADVDSQAHGITLVAYNASYGNESLARLLLCHKANPNIATGDGKTPLHHAVQFSKWGKVMLLLEHQASLHIPDQNGITPLDTECQVGSEEDRKKVREILAPYKEQARKD